jgi:hypothetical protein
MELLKGIFRTDFLRILSITAEEGNLSVGGIVETGFIRCMGSWASSYSVLLGWELHIGTNMP